jgi:hypothetical protein
LLALLALGKLVDGRPWRPTAVSFVRQSNYHLSPVSRYAAAPVPGGGWSAILCTDMNFTLFSALLLLPAMVVLLQLGHALRRRRESAPQSSAIEGAVFALFGLLLAFTFFGAVTRYDAHRELVLQESNDIGTAYLRLDLLAPQDQPPLRQLFRDYVNSRLHL